MKEDIMSQQELTEKILIIGKQYNLALDKIGKLEEATAGVLNGSLPPDDFVGKLENELDIDEDTIIEIAKDVNLEIFIPARQNLIDNTDKETELTKENILAEIEDPEPTSSPAPSSTPVQQEQKKPQQPSANTVPNVAHDFIENKLSEPVSLPTQKKTIDPYREPIE